jgi:hypothetical protein
MLKINRLFEKQFGMDIFCLSIAKDDILNEYYFENVLNEAYVGKTEALLEIEKAIHELRKNHSYFTEINNSKEALRRLNCRIGQIYEFELPESHEKRAIIHIVKEKETNKKYPRQYTDIKRQPL